MVSRRLQAKYFSLLICFLFFCLCSLQAQQDTLFYKISFSDKSASNYDVLNPSQFLSERAMIRRANYSIPVTEQDLPVCQTYFDSVLFFTSVKWVNQSKWFNTLIVTCDDTNDVNVIKNWSFVADLNAAKMARPKISSKFDN